LINAWFQNASETGGYWGRISIEETESLQDRIR
jgi:hypothetical protein